MWRVTATDTAAVVVVFFMLFVSFVRLFFIFFGFLFSICLKTNLYVSESLSLCVWWMLDADIVVCVIFEKKKKIIISKPVPHSDSHLNGDPMGMKDSQSNICITDLMTLFHSMFFSLFDSYLKSHFQLKL